MSERTPAVGGRRTVPVPDPVARDDLLLSLRLDQRIPGLVDAYYGPAALKAQVDMEQLRSPARLRDDAAALLERLGDGATAGEVPDAGRRRWLAAQVVALETQARELAGDPLPYLEHVSRCFDLRPKRTPERVFEEATRALDELLPPVAGASPAAGEGQRGATAARAPERGGGAARDRGSIADRIAAWDAGFTLREEQILPVLDWLLDRFRSEAAALFGLPAGEAVVVSLVRNQPWSGYNWYDGGGVSRVDINVDLPVRVADLIQLAAHEAYPGHHTEHAWKERALVEDRGRLEASIQLINAPECLISEGLADLGRMFVAPDDRLADLLVELYSRAGLTIARDAAAAREAAERSVAIRRALDAVRGVAGNAALMLHADGVPREEVRAYLRRYLLTTPDRADKRLSFIEHPLWRTYVFVYFEGERLLRRWVLGAPSAEDRVQRFGRLLREELTPGAIAAEASAG